MLNPVFSHFKNKDELILASTLKAAKIFNAMGEEQIYGCTDLWEKFMAAIKTYQIFYNNFPDHFRLFLMWDNIKIDFNSIDQKSVPAEYLKETNKIQEYFLEIIKKGIEEKKIREIDNPKKTLFIFMNTIFGYFRNLATRTELIEKRFGYTFDDCITGLVILIERTFKM